MTAPIPTPCRKVCRLGADQRCDGCGRTVAELASWLWFTPGERAAVMERVRDWRIRGADDDSTRTSEDRR